MVLDWAGLTAEGTCLVHLDGVFGSLGGARWENTRRDAGVLFLYNISLCTVLHTKIKVV